MGVDSEPARNQPYHSPDSNDQERLARTYARQIFSQAFILRTIIENTSASAL